MQRISLAKRSQIDNGWHELPPTDVRAPKWQQTRPSLAFPPLLRLILLSSLAVYLFSGPSAAFSCQNGVKRRARPTQSSFSVNGTESNASSSNTPLVATSSLVVVDVDNVRGKSSFQWTHEGLLERTTAWRNTFHHQEVSLALVVDHGSIPCLHTSGPLDDQVGIFFSGNAKADDVILSLVRDICASDGADTHIQTTIVTADRALMASCQEACPKKSKLLKFMEPISFLQELESLPVSSEDYKLHLTEHRTSQQESHNVEDVGDSIRKEVALQQELQMLNRLLHPRGTRSNGKKKQVSKKQRTKLVARRDRARERLQELLESEHDATLSSVLDTTSDSSLLNGATQSITRSRMPSSYSIESTYERQLLAERLRRRLDRAETLSTPIDEYTNYTNIYDVIRNSKCDQATVINGEGTDSPTSKNQDYNRDGRSLSASVLTIPRRHFDKDEEYGSENDIPSTLLRIVTISDTHGYEHELFAHYSATDGESPITPHLLPPADVLIHCGDFTESGSRKIKLQAKKRLDAFLAAQTHIPTKIVLRGNHDPHTPARVLFPRSNATYITKPTTMSLKHNITLGLRPYSRRGTILLLPPCDILASHEPPFGILDMSYQQVRAGSITLRRAVESSTHKPSLWLCGHIHEGRGSVLHSFVDPHGGSGAECVDATLVVNAANANAGRANRIVTGPVLVDVVKNVSLLDDKAAWTTGARADTSPVTMIRSDSIQHMVTDYNEKHQQPNTDDSRRLLAVDLGLRTATVVMNGNGDILDVQDWRFTNHAQLENALQDVLQRHSITHVVVEGSDVKLVRIWRRAVETYFPDLPFARVVAEDWREALLLPKERRNKQTAKDAAVLIAKQFWNNMEHKEASSGESKTKLTKDAAEAILVGQYAVRVLGWVDSKQPAVKRYSIGNIAR